MINEFSEDVLNEEKTDDFIDNSERLNVEISDGAFDDVKGINSTSEDVDSLADLPENSDFDINTGENTEKGYAFAADLKNGAIFEEGGDEFQVIEFLHIKPGKGNSFIRMELKNILTGEVIEKDFSSTAKLRTSFAERKEA